MYALDTNTVIYFFKGMGRVAERLLATPRTEVAVPAVVLFELEAGVRKTREATARRRQLDDFAEAVAILPFDRASAEAAAEIRARLEQRGRPMGPLDTLIAGTALAHGTVLVSHNVAEFGRVDGLTVTDWF
jgi:tRNA(fMet)-specific endonuclease VapC